MHLHGGTHSHRNGGAPVAGNTGATGSGGGGSTGGGSTGGGGEYTAHGGAFSNDGHRGSSYELWSTGGRPAHMSAPQPPKAENGVNGAYMLASIGTPAPPVPSHHLYPTSEPFMTSAHVASTAAESSYQVMRAQHVSAPMEMVQPQHPSQQAGGHSHMPQGQPESAALTPWQVRMEAKVDRLLAHVAQMNQLLASGAVMVAQPKAVHLGEASPAHLIAAPMARGVLPHQHHLMHGHPHGHSHVLNGMGGMSQSGGHSTSDKIDARRRRYPGFRGVPVCACCNKSFCLIFNSPNGKCKRGEQCEHAHHYMPPNAPTGSMVHPLAAPAPFK